MNSSIHLKGISFRNSRVFRTAVISILIICAVFVLVVALFWYSVQIKAQKLSNKADEIQAQTSLKNNYSEAAATYDSALMNYNSEVEDFNEFIAAVTKYGLVDNCEPIEKASDAAAPAEITDQSLEDITQATTVLKDNTKAIQEKRDQLSYDIMSALTEEHNDLAAKYNDAVQFAAVEYIEGLPSNITETGISEYEKGNISTEDISAAIDELGEVSASYQVVLQLTAPSLEWVKERLAKCDHIVDYQEVTQANNPDGLLGKEGGYTDCVYFTVKGLDTETVTGYRIVEIGNDAGGTVEIYATREEAMNRCDYLSQFDNTYLYSGSYTAAGTIVVRTSYKLSNTKQVELTNEIITALTARE